MNYWVKEMLEDFKHVKDLTSEDLHDLLKGICQQYFNRMMGSRVEAIGALHLIEQEIIDEARQELLQRGKKVDW